MNTRDLEMSVAEGKAAFEFENTAIKTELEFLWNDLDDARRSAVNGVWSMRCDSLVYRITMLTLHSGYVVPWDEVSAYLLRDGIYQKVYAEIGVTAPVDMNKVQQTLDWLEERRKR